MFDDMNIGQELFSKTNTGKNLALKNFILANQNLIKPAFYVATLIIFLIK